MWTTYLLSNYYIILYENLPFVKLYYYMNIGKHYRVISLVAGGDQQQSKIRISYWTYICQEARDLHKLTNVTLIKSECWLWFHKGHKCVFLIENPEFVWPIGEPQPLPLTLTTSFFADVIITLATRGCYLKCSTSLWHSFPKDGNGILSRVIPPKKYAP